MPAGAGRTRRDFDRAAERWDANPDRRRLSLALGRALLRTLRPTPELDVLDYGCGTGLITLQFLPRVRRITAADSSAGMLRVLGKKLKAAGLTRVRRLRWDAETEPAPPTRYDLILSTMTFHHLGRISRVLRAFRRTLVPGGRLAIADLDAEDGSFHADPRGVRHQGFSRRVLSRRLLSAGFRRVRFSTTHRFSRRTTSGRRRFSAFLLVAEK